VYSEVDQGVSHALHLATVVTHREVTLHEVAERSVEVKHACFAIADELVLDHAPDLARGDAVLFGDVLKLVGDHANPGVGNALHALPSRVVDRRGIREGVVSKVVAL
jgi:hypothetical protein